MPESSELPLRLFFALGCPSELADQIGSWRDSQNLGGQPVATENLHLTLAFLGSQPAAALDGLIQLGGELREEAFTLRLDQLQTIGTDFLCLTPSRPPRPLLRLVAHVHSGLTALGVSLDSRPFLPHVTLARRADSHPLRPAPEAFEWRVKGFGLFRSENTTTGVHYAELAHWSLIAPSG